MPFAFTEMGVAMLSSVLKSETALDIEDILKDQNDINEMTRMHLDNLDQAFALLQSERKRDKPKPIIGFGIKDND